VKAVVSPICPILGKSRRQNLDRMTVQEQVDRAYRVAYRLAYPVVWCWWRLLKRQEGVVVAVWLDDAVLGVRHSYRPGLFLVHGGVGRREDHRLAAARELAQSIVYALAGRQLRANQIKRIKVRDHYEYHA
jgi:hypothetical protein